MPSNADTVPPACAVVVTYRPQREVAENILLLRNQVQQIVIIDNGSEEKLKGLLTEVAKFSDVRVFPSWDNDGLGTALNFGIQFAIEAGYEWIATFDQDSTIDDDFFVQQFSALAA